MFHRLMNGPGEVGSANDMSRWLLSGWALKQQWTPGSGGDVRGRQTPLTVSASSLLFHV